MSNPISPAIIINETFQPRAEIVDGYNVLVKGFTSSGVANDPRLVNNIDSWLAEFGEPDPSRPEQIYAYQSVRDVVNGGANAVFVKLPYGANEGIDVGTDFSALVYPAIEDQTSNTAIVGYEISEFIPASSFGATLSSEFPFDDDIEAGEFITPEAFNAATAILSPFATPVEDEVDCEGFLLGEPTRICLTEEEFDKIKCQQFEWNNLQPLAGLSAYDGDLIGNAGMIILDESRSTTSDAKEGFYITVTDNSDADPATDFDSITGIQTSFALNGATVWDDVPEECYNFDLTSPFSSNVGSISQFAANNASQAVFETWEEQIYKNYLSVNLWRLVPDLSNGSGQLVPTLIETHTGSVSDAETVISEGGSNRSVFLEDVVDGDSNRLCVLFNPLISEADYTDSAGEKIRNIRMFRNSPDVLNGLTLSGADAEPTFQLNPADNAYSVSKFVSKADRFACDVGNIPAKIRNASCSVDNPDRLNIDLSIEAGLGTIWTTVREDRNSWLTGDQRDNSFCYDDCAFIDVKADLGRTTPEGNEPGEMRVHWREVVDQFRDLIELRACNGGFRHLHVVDPLRQIFVNSHCKVYDNRTRCRNAGAFAECIYHPLKNLSRGLNDSHITGDANWWQTSNIYSSNPVWTPSSSVVACLLYTSPSPRDKRQSRMPSSA